MTVRAPLAGTGSSITTVTVMRRTLICSALAGAVLAAIAPAVVAQQPAPPRSIKDLVAQIEAAKPHPERIAELNAVLAEAFPASAPVPEQIIFLRRQAQAAEELGHTGKEMELKRRNAELARGTPDAARILMELAVRERLYGDLTQSMQLVDEVIRLAPPAGALIGAYGRVAIDRIAVGDVAGAEEAQRNADAAYRRAMLNARAAEWFRSLWRNQLECLRGSHLSLRGKLADADAAFRRSIEAAIEDAGIAAKRFATPGLNAPLPNVAQTARDVCETNWARNLMQQRRHVDAEILLRAQVERVMARVGRDSPQVANALGGLGAVYARQGRYADAEALLGEAVRIYERVGAENGSGLVGRARGEYAQALYVRGAYAEAAAQVEHWTGAPERNPGAGATYLIALVQVGQGARALSMTEWLLPRVELRYGSAHLFSGQLRGARAMALQATGAKAEALAAYRSAVRTMADARVRTSGSDDGSASLGKHIFGHILEGYLGLLADLQGPEFSHLFREPPALESFAVADMIRAGSVQKALAASAARASADPQLAEVVRREQDFGEELAALHRTLGGLLAAPLERQLTKVIADMRTRIGAIEKQQAALAVDIERRFPAYVNLIAPKPPTQAETQRVLRAGEAVLAVLVGETRTYVWAVPKNGAMQFHAAPVGAKGIEALTARVRRTVDPFSHGLPGIPPFALDEAHELYRIVVAPVAATLGDARQVIVSANGALGAFPFAMLPTAPAAVNLDATPAYVDYRKVPWLLRRHAITQVPSVNALVTLRALPPRSAAAPTFAGIGDPIFSREQMTAQSAAGALRGAAGAAGVGGASVAVRGGVQVALRSAGRLDQIDSVDLGRLARLPDTNDEVREIAAIFGAGSEMLLQTSANEKEVKARDWRGKRVILFATHGLVPGELNGLDQPALALTAPEVAGVEGDGLLTVEEILNLKLDADWVVLSACNTASGSAAGAEALSGLGRAFFYAGTRALLASNWPVETVSAKQITTGIFKRQAAQPALSKADALRATMLDLMDAGEAKDGAGKAVYSYAHPLFWAPFSLVGDGS